LMPDHVHMMISIPPKYAVSQVVGFIKGKSAIHLARVYGEKKRNFVGQHFWARGHFVSTVGRDEAVDTRVHQKPGARGQPLGPNEFVALIGHLQVANECQGRVSDPERLRAARFLKPPALLGGYLPYWPHGFLRGPAD
jgi:hypothetical protein